MKDYFMHIIAIKLRLVNDRVRFIKIRISVPLENMPYYLYMAMEEIKKAAAETVVKTGETVAEQVEDLGTAAETMGPGRQFSIDEKIDLWNNGMRNDSKEIAALALKRDESLLQYNSLRKEMGLPDAAELPKTVLDADKKIETLQKNEASIMEEKKHFLVENKEEYIEKEKEKILAEKVVSVERYFATLSPEDREKIKSGGDASLFEKVFMKVLGTFSPESAAILLAIFEKNGGRISKEALMQETVIYQTFITISSAEADAEYKKELGEIPVEAPQDAKEIPQQEPTIGYEGGEYTTEALASRLENENAQGRNEYNPN